MPLCSFEGCGRRRTGRGLCSGHYARLRKGLPMQPLLSVRPLVPNPECPGTVLVPLADGSHALIDAEDADAVRRFNWHAPARRRGPRYAETSIYPNGRKKKLALHLVVWANHGMPSVPIVDHRSRDTLDCRFSNLRAATIAQNARNRRQNINNSSGATGVSLHYGKWQVSVGVDSKRITVGTFTDFEQAAQAAADARVRLHAEFSSAVK